MIKNRKIFSVINQKGGSGKTHTSALMAMALATKGKTLCIDADPQAGLL